jgi:hypothetical protein
MHDSPFGLSLRRMLRPRRIVMAALLCFANALVLAQAKSADYTDDMPSVDQVRAAIKGSDANDTLVRQYAAFIGLNKHIFDIKAERTVNGPYTPSEQRVRNTYDAAKTEIEHE